jgi:F0F1-type ATP synthase membrane subunit b/b'
MLTLEQEKIVDEEMAQIEQAKADAEAATHKYLEKVKQLKEEAKEAEKRAKRHWKKGSFYWKKKPKMLSKRLLKTHPTVGIQLRNE